MLLHMQYLSCVTYHFFEENYIDIARKAKYLGWAYKITDDHQIFMLRKIGWITPMSLFQL